jgi:hypothetical protein
MKSLVQGHCCSREERSSIFGPAVSHTRRCGGSALITHVVSIAGMHCNNYASVKNYNCQECLFFYKAWQVNNNSNNFILYCDITRMDQGEPGLDYDDPNLNPLVCDICNKSFDSLDKLGEHQKKEHDM